MGVIIVANSISQLNALLPQYISLLGGQIDHLQNHGTQQSDTESNAAYDQLVKKQQTLLDFLSSYQTILESYRTAYQTLLTQAYADTGMKALLTEITSLAEKINTQCDQLIAENLAQKQEDDEREQRRQVSEDAKLARELAAHNGPMPVDPNEIATQEPNQDRRDNPLYREAIRALVPAQPRLQQRQQPPFATHPIANGAVRGGLIGLMIGLAVMAVALATSAALPIVPIIVTLTLIGATVGAAVAAKKAGFFRGEPPASEEAEAAVGPTPLTR